MQKFVLIISSYAVLATYPACVQVSEWVNSALDNWAVERVGSVELQSSNQLNEQLDGIRNTLPKHLQTPLPISKPERK